MILIASVSKPMEMYYALYCFVYITYLLLCSLSRVLARYCFQKQKVFDKGIIQGASLKTLTCLSRECYPSYWKLNLFQFLIARNGLISLYNVMKN